MNPEAEYERRRQITHEMERLREMLDDGEISNEKFNREYGPLARQLVGDVEFERAKRG